MRDCRMYEKGLCKHTDNEGELCLFQDADDRFRCFFYEGKNE